MKKLIIDRKKWYRGRGTAESRLRLKNGTMCCLGFYALSCGKTEDEILDKSYLLTEEYDMYSLPTTEEAEWLNSELEYPYCSTSRLLGFTNDDVDLKEEDREQQISEIFAKNGVEVEFVN